MARALMVALLAVLVVGCGGSQPDQAVRDYLKAIAQRDGGRACDQLSPQLRADIERSPAASRAGRSCADVMGLASGLDPALSTKEVDELAIDVDESGDRATAQLKNPLSRRREALELVKDDGDWKISTLVTRPRG